MRGLDLISRAVRRTLDVSAWEWATVTDDSPLRVQLDGESAPLDMTVSTSSLVANLAIGDRVWCQLVSNPNPQRSHRRVVIHGRQGGQLIAADTVTNAMLAEVATDTFKGRDTAGTGNPEDLSIATARTMLGTARMGCALRRVATQTFNDSTVTTVSWDTQDEDTDGLWSSGSTVTIPADGIWAISYTLWGGGTATGRGLASIIISGITLPHRSAFQAGEQYCTVTAVKRLSASTTFTCEAYADMAGNSTLTASLDCYRMSV